MSINIFEGARRIALLLAAVATIGTLAVAVFDEPYVSATYSVSYPNGPFIQSDDSCPTEAGKHYFSTKTSTGKSISVDLCLLTIPFGEDRTQLIPYKIDGKGMTWGAASYSNEIRSYEKQLEQKFKLPPTDEAVIAKKISERYWSNFKSNLSYLAGGLVIFAAIVWSIGWIVRGFLGIPRGMDKRPDSQK